MYYVMDCKPKIREDGGAVLSLNNNFKLAGIRLWKTGSLIKKERTINIPNPVTLDFDACNGYRGSPREITDLGIPVMSKRLCDVLLNAGVDNLELFPAKLKNKQTDQVFDYYVYNILGLLDSMSLQQSANEASESKINDLLLFRLTENVSAIIVHESLEKAIEEAGITTVSFIKPENFSQI